MEALKVLEKFIDEEKEILAQYVPKFFASKEQLTIVDAVKMIKDLAGSLINENKLLTNYVKEHMENDKLVDMVKKSLKDKQIKLEEPKTSIDMNELKKRLEESILQGRKTEQSTKT